MGRAAAGLRSWAAAAASGPVPHPSHAPSPAAPSTGANHNSFRLLICEPSERPIIGRRAVSEFERCFNLSARPRRGRAVVRSSVGDAGEVIFVLLLGGELL